MLILSLHLLNRYISGGFIFNINVKKFTMDNQKLNTERLIRSLKRRKGVSRLFVCKYRSYFYFQISGFLNGKIFLITTTEVDGEEKCNISTVTVCKEEIEKILIKFNLV